VTDMARLPVLLIAGVLCQAHWFAVAAFRTYWSRALADSGDPLQQCHFDECARRLRELNGRAGCSQGPLDEGSFTKTCKMHCLLLICEAVGCDACQQRDVVERSKIVAWSPANSPLPMLHVLQVCPHVLPLLLQAAATHVAGAGSS
jgi:hypothetical protein